MDRAVTAGGRGDAILATEFGATGDVATLRRLTGAFDSRLIPWIFWTYDENLVADLHAPPTGANVRTGALGALVRPNPQAVNGTPTSADFDPETRGYDFTYSTTRPDGTPADRHLRTSIVLPARIYPDGYTVTVDGARIRTLLDHARAAQPPPRRVGARARHAGGSLRATGQILSRPGVPVPC